MLKMYHRDFYEPSELILGDVVKKFGINIKIDISFKALGCKYNLVLHYPHKPSKLGKKEPPIEWNDFKKELDTNPVDLIDINCQGILYHIAFWRDKDIIGSIHCKDIDGLPGKENL